MQINPELIISSFDQGQQIPIENPRALTEVEDVLADHFLPLPSARTSTLEAARISWDHRMPLDEALRNRTFNGRLLDVVLEPIDEPYKELLSIKPDFVRRPIARQAIGFVVHAALSSTGSTEMGQLHRPVWLLPRTQQMLSHGLWQRIIGPVLGDDDIERLHKDAVSRGLRFAGADTGPTRKGARKGTLWDGSEHAN